MNSRSGFGYKHLFNKSIVSSVFMVVFSGFITSCAMHGGYATPSYYQFEKGVAEGRAGIKNEASEIYSFGCPENLALRPKDRSTLDQRVCHARAYANFKIEKYRSIYNELKLTNTFLFDLPLIGLAIAAGAAPILSYSADTIGSLTLGAAAGTGLRTYFNSNQKADQYIKAEAAAQCVINNSFAFVNAKDKADAMEGNLTILGRAILYSRLLLLNDKFTNPDLKTELLKAIGTSETANDDGRKAIAVIDTSDDIIINTINVIDLKLRSNINNDKVDLKAVTDAISSSTEKKERPEVKADRRLDLQKIECPDDKLEPTLCNCKNYLEFVNAKPDEFALYCILDIDRQSDAISDEAKRVIKYIEEDIGKTCPDKL